MSQSEPPFLFDAEGSHLAAEDFIVRLPEGIRDKASLLSCYAIAGHFPDYFGNNWDALNDCLRDFSWIRQKKIIIVHSDLPLSGDGKELHVYLEILQEALRSWASSKQHELLVIFPPETQATTTRLLDK
jgi:RNAse (barnase) inhibitor barstar